MHYTVTRIFEPSDQVYDSNRFATLEEAISEADKAISMPLTIRVVVEDDDRNICYRTMTGGR